MRVILILFLILFVIISSLFLTTFISRAMGPGVDAELAGEIPMEDESISVVSDIRPDTAPEMEAREGPSQEGSGAQAPEDNEGYSSDTAGAESSPEEDPGQGPEEDVNGGGSPVEGEDQDGPQEEAGPQQDMVKIYLDGDMENGIYLGAASYGIESSRAEELYGPDLSDTGFRFEWKNTDLDLEPGSTHFVYIFYYNTANGWEYLRKEVNITGQKPGDKDIKIFIDEPTEKKAVDSLEGIRGWALDSASQDDTGIARVSIYLDGPRGFGVELGEADYGIPRTGVVDFFDNENYLYSGYTLTVKDPGLEQGSKHTLFVYAEGLHDAGKYNFEKTDIFIAGEREEKAVIEASIDLQALVDENRLYIEGYAMGVDRMEEFMQKQQEESSAQQLTDQDPSGGSLTTGSGGSSIRKLVFKSNRDGNYNIFSINLDGSGLQRLTDNSGDDLYPEASPDGKKIAYTAEIKGIWQVMIMDWNGQNKRQVTHNSYRSAYPSWSHDMRYIYFEAYIDGDWELFRINSDGTGQKRLTHNSNGHDWHPSGHPFDSKVIFESGLPGHDDLYIMDSNGSSISRIFSRHERRRTPDMSSDATKLVYTRYFGSNSEVYYADIRDQNEIRITHNSDWDGHPMFSPDDSLIVYEQRSGSREDLIIYDIKTGARVNVTNSGYKDSDACFLYQ